MNQKLYLECYAGISGDMTVGALLDLGADEDKLRKTLKSLALDGYAVEIKRVKKAGLDVCDFAVVLDAEHENHDHDMEYLHGPAGSALQGMEHTHDLAKHDYSQGASIAETQHTHEGGAAHPHDCEHIHEKAPDYIHEHGNETAECHHHHHGHRGLPEILEILKNSDMTARAKEIAERIFQILAGAEAKAHGVPLAEVHFHEVGAVDSIVDVAAVAICLDDLGIEDVVVPVLYEGCGTVRCQHGVMPVPAPATLNIISAYHLCLHQTDTFGEFVTPTGAAIVAAVCTERELPERYMVEKTGLGAGKRTYERPSILRAMLITPELLKKVETQSPLENGLIGNVQGQKGDIENQTDCIVKLECNVDDCTGETLGYAMERLFAAGARDAFFTPVYMKKNRPGYLLTVLCTPETADAMEAILFTETSTIGVRRVRMERGILPRETGRMQTKVGAVRVKTVKFDNGERRIPEYESVAKIARERGKPFRDLYKQIEAEINGYQVVYQ